MRNYYLSFHLFLTLVAIIAFPSIGKEKKIAGYSIKSIKTANALGPLKETVNSGNWGQANIYSPAGIPTQTTYLNIKHPVNLDRSLTISSNATNEGYYIFGGAVTDVNNNRNITLSQKGRLDVNATLTLGRNLAASGTSIININAASSIGGNLNITGTAAANISSPANIEGNLTVANTAALVISANTSIAGSLTASGTTMVTTNSIRIVSGATLTIGNGGVSSISSGSKILVEEGGTLVIIGDLNNAGLLTVNGSLQVQEGDYNGAVTGKIVGSGSFSTEGAIVLAPGNNATQSQSTIFDSPLECTVNCVRNNLCNNDAANNTIVGDSSACSSFDPKLIVGNAIDNAYYFWEKSTSSAESGFKNMTDAQGEKDFDPEFTSVSNTYYRRGYAINNGECIVNKSNIVTISVSSGNNQNWQGTVSHDWNNPANWCGNKVPTRSVSVIIEEDSVSITGSAEFRDLVLKSSGIVYFNGTKLTVARNFTNEGKFIHKGGTVEFIGTGNQTITGDNTWEDVVINNTGAGTNGVRIAAASPVQIFNGPVTLTTGTLYTNGKATLDFEQGGAIAGTGSGRVNGKLNGRRTIFGGEHITGSPFANVSLTQYANYKTKDSRIWYYDETNTLLDINKGYIAVNIASNAESFKGYWTRIAGTGQVQLTGDYLHEQTSYSTGQLTYTSTGNPTSDGWHLLANPYPSYIDWRKTDGWVKNNIESSIYLYRSDKNKTFAVFNTNPEIGEDAAVNGGSPYIPAMQAFWIQTKDNNSSLTVNNNARVVNVDFTGFDGVPSYYRKAATAAVKTLKLKVTGASLSDETILRFFANATDEYDGKFDATKLTGDAGSANLYTALGNEIYSINTLSDFQGSKTVALEFVAPAGTYTLSAVAFKNFEGKVFLKDKKAGVTSELTSATNYQFTTVAGDAASRFEIIFAAGESLTSVTGNKSDNNLLVVNNTNTLDLILNTTASENADITIVNTLGHEILRRENVEPTSGIYSINKLNLNSGIYIVRAKIGEMNYSKKVFLDKQ